MTPPPPRHLRVNGLTVKNIGAYVCSVVDPYHFDLDPIRIWIRSGSGSEENSNFFLLSKIYAYFPPIGKEYNKLFS